MILWSHAAGEIQEMVWVPDVAHGHLGRDPGAESFTEYEAMTRGEFTKEHGDLIMKHGIFRDSIGIWPWNMGFVYGFTYQT